MEAHEIRQAVFSYGGEEGVPESVRFGEMEAHEIRQAVFSYGGEEGGVWSSSSLKQKEQGGGGGDPVERLCAVLEKRVVSSCATQVIDVSHEEALARRAQGKDLHDAKQFELTPWQQEKDRERERVRKILLQVAGEQGFILEAGAPLDHPPPPRPTPTPGLGEVDDGAQLSGRGDVTEAHHPGGGGAVAAEGESRTPKSKIADAVKQFDAAPSPKMANWKSAEEASEKARLRAQIMVLEKEVHEASAGKQVHEQEGRVGRAPDVQGRSKASFTFTSPGRDGEEQTFYLPSDSEERRKKRGPSFLSPLRRSDLEDDALSPRLSSARDHGGGSSGDISSVSLVGSAAGGGLGLGNAVKDIDGGLFKLAANGEEDGYSRGGGADCRLRWKSTTTELCGERESVVLLRGEPKDDLERGLAEIRTAKAELNTRLRGSPASQRPHQRPLQSILKSADAAARQPVSSTGQVIHSTATPLHFDEISVNL
jgi:hypothetical protein